MKFSDYGTNFEKPLIDAYWVVAETNDEFSELRLYFLSDGSAYYPTFAVNKLAKNAGFMAKLSFTVIDFGGYVVPGGSTQFSFGRKSSLE